MKILDFLFKSKFTNGVVVVFTTIMLLLYLMIWLAFHILAMVSVVLAIQDIAINGKDAFINLYVGVLCLGMYLLLFWMINALLRFTFDIKGLFMTIKNNTLLLFNKKVVKE
ncbi:hypothetical protein [Staphylococcus aureus]|uniref:hypothetical protein n=1 Tax=Staphylococcus aureus TaxID=1280 RepID=UPI0029C03A64|nr:hypothetical protein [Staphylococcus aureus]WPG01515.1 hypothetical protein SE117_11750 [Staphylococcus aureus]